jgi:hypothetical protein
MILMVSLLLVLAVVVAVTVMLLSSPPQEEQNELLLVSDIPFESIVAMTISSESGTLQLERQDGGWHAVGSDMAVDSLTCEGMATYLSYVYAVEVVEQEPASVGKYGLDNPALTAELMLADGSRVVYMFGVMTADQTAVYFMKSGDGRLFTMMSAHFAQIRSSLTDLVDLSLPEIDSTDITEITFKKGAIEQTLVRSGVFESGFAFEESGVAAAAAFIGQVQKTAGMRLNAYVGDEVLPEHGLNKGDYFRITDRDGSALVVRIGDKTEDGKHFCTVDGKHGVFLADEALTAFIVDDLSLCMDKRLIPIAPENIESVTWQGGGQHIELDALYARSTVDGKQQGEVEYEALMEALLTADTSGIIDSAAGDAVYTLTVYLVGGGLQKVTLHEYLKGFYALDYGKGPWLYIKADRLEAIATAR